MRDMSGNLAHALKRERKRQGMTLEELSKLSGLSTSLISMVERGRRNVTLRTLAIFEEALSTQLMVFYDIPLDAEEWQLLNAWKEKDFPLLLDMIAKHIRLDESGNVKTIDVIIDELNEGTDRTTQMTDQKTLTTNEARHSRKTSPGTH